MRRPNRVVTAIDGESKRCAEKLDASGLIDRLLRGYNLVADAGGAGGNHADILGCGAGEIENASANERSTVVDADDDAAAIVLVGDPKARTEGERTMGCSKICGTHAFP